MLFCTLTLYAEISILRLMTYRGSCIVIFSVPEDNGVRPSDMLPMMDSPLAVREPPEMMRNSSEFKLGKIIQIVPFSAAFVVL